LLDHASFSSFILRTVLTECPVIPAIRLKESSHLSSRSEIFLYLVNNAEGLDFAPLTQPVYTPFNFAS